MSHIGIINDFLGDLDPGVDVGIQAWGYLIDIVGGEVFLQAFLFQNIHCFVVCNCGFQISFVGSYYIISADVNAGSISILSVFLCFCNSVEGIDNLDILTSDICSTCVAG